MEKYEQIAIVGEGSYGLVIKCRHKETDQLVAVKKFLETEEDATIRKMALREIRMLKKLKHENLVTMIEVFRHKKRFYLVFEYLEGTILDELEKYPNGLGEERCRERIFQVIRGISYCHSNNIIHRDVKPENVLVSSLGVVKLCDFGFARIINISGDICTEYVATRWYRAPELLVGESNYGAAVDIWAIGCLFAEIMAGDPIFPGESDIDQLYLIVKLLGKPCTRHQHLISKSTQLRNTIKSPYAETGSNLYKQYPMWQLQAIEFLHCCLRMDPNERLTADELLKHTYFQHDRFAQKFLPALREKVNIEFNNPLLRKYKTEILMASDKRDELRTRRPFDYNKWRINLQDTNSNKRKLSNCDENLINLTKSTQKLNYIQKMQQNKQLLKEKHRQLIGNNVVEMQMLEKSLESLAKFTSQQKTDENFDEKPTDTSTLINLTPPPFSTFGFSFGDNNKSQHLLHPSINNISFTREPLKKSPQVLQNLTVKNVTPSVVGRNQFLKKLDRNVVVENLFNTENSNNNNGPPIWFNSFGAVKKKMDLKAKNDEFSLPNLPGATNSPSKPKKKSLPEIDLTNSNNITPRIQSSTSTQSKS